MDNEKQIIEAATNGTTAHINVSLDEDSKSLYAAGPSSLEPVDTALASSSSGVLVPQTGVVWEDIMKTIRL